MCEIRPIEPHQVAAAKALIYRVAHQVFQDSRSLDESIAFYEGQRQLHDMDDVQRTYFDNRGVFLVMWNGDELIGTGAIRRIDDEICELKRLWLLSEFHGRGLGYQMTQALLGFARQQGYRKIRLETDRSHQQRAYDFYKRLGFYEIARYSDNEEDAAMEMQL